MTESQRRSLLRLLDDDSKTFEQFNVLITAFCHNNPIIKACFGGITEYTEMLLPANVLAQGGFLDLLNHTDYITDDDFKSPELIGWLYQFYISERKAEVFAKKGKYTPDEIPAATQIFTPNWIVKYMVQNTVGRIYLDNNPSETEIQKNWRYFVESTEPTPQEGILKCNDITELKVADLACGSGHILNECFDLLLELYINEGYSRRDAIESIFSKNLLGIDIDTRAKQLATFSLLLKACLQDDSFLDAHTLPRIYDMPRPFAEVMREWMHGETDAADVKPLIGAQFSHYLMGATDQMKQELADAVWLMNLADTLGSIMKFNLSEDTRNALSIRTAEYEELLVQGEAIPEPSRLLMQYAHIILALTERYSAIVMNPPYMGSRSMGDSLTKYINEYYADGKADFCTVFMLMEAEKTLKGGYYALITPPSWMFNSSFESLRKSILNSQSINSLLHLSRGVFGADFGSVSCVIQNSKNEQAKGTYFRLIERTFQEFDQKHLRILFEKTLANPGFKYYFANYTKDVEDIVYNEKGAKVYYPNVSQSIFKKIPGSPIGFWASEKMTEAFSFPTIGSISAPRQGMATSDNNRFLRMWYEPNFGRIGFNCRSREESRASKCRWFPYNKGGTFRKWYGNNDYVVNWENDGEELLSFAANLYGSPTRTIKNIQHYFKDSVTWSALSSGAISLRYSPCGFLFDTKGQCIFTETREQKVKIMAFLNSKPSVEMLKILAPTWDFNSGVIAKLPFNGENISIREIDNCINISKQDWDAHETSWDFQGNELVDMTANKYIDIMHDYGDWIGAMVDLAPPQLESLEWRVGVFKTRWETQFERLHANEEELNRQFIDIYGLQDELTPDVPMDEVTILQQGEISIKNDEIVWHDDVLMKQLISYAVGCMMGRYSIDKPGLILANQGDGMKEYRELVPNGRFEVDDDGIVPLMSRDCPFADNAVNRFAEFIRILMGEATQTENLSYVDQCLGKPLENYLVKDFWKDHKKMYQKRPIYWLFSSKKGAFQVVAYMHRMTPYTVEHIRVNYLLRHIDYLSTEIEAMQSRSATLNTAERRRLDKLIKDHQECLEYEERLHAVADQQISMDLDDGVVVNYAKFGDVLAKLN